MNSVFPRDLTEAWRRALSCRWTVLTDPNEVLSLFGACDSLIYVIASTVIGTLAAERCNAGAMKHPDYIARAERAEAEARKAKSPDVAKGWQELAETYRALAAQLERIHQRERVTVG